ncbi:eukaryotic initiation factor 4f subunit p130 [Lentinula edodes]|uniref:Eukaryotic initiation factor 4f subunit p130 n=1 Tax=Lentinula edodes TaxID=5353 RepID=A0A1Q3DZY9_LENED|nr:eukaryotic initiation factor 4f subunit p130 [Lentinula edodes]
MNSLSNSSVPTTSQAPATQLIPKFNVRLPQMQASEQTGLGTDYVNHENFQEGPGHPSESLPKCKSHPLDLSTSIAGKSDNPAPQLSAFATARIIGKRARTPFGEMGISLEPVASSLWDRKAIANVDQDSPEIVDCKLKILLNRLTIKKFDSISDRIIALANKSEKEKDGRTLIQVIRLVFEKATDGENQSEMYARLCRKMMEQISAKVQDDGIRNAEGEPIVGGNLFRKYLLNRCQEDFERGWFNKEATAAAAATKAKEEQSLKAANTTKEEEEVALYSDEYYAAQKAKRQGLGLIKFIGELFKLQMLTERIMHECVKKLLGNVENPEEEEIESLCKLLITVGQMLDTPKARAHMNVYFDRMKELTKSTNVNSRMQFMLQDVIELRERKWQERNAVAAPTTIAKIHEAAAKEKDAYVRRLNTSMSRTGSRRGGDRNNHQAGADGWTVTGNAPRPPAKVGDLSKFGQISKGAPMTFGPSSVFAGKKESKRESLSRTNSNANMFQMLQNVEAAEVATKTSRPPSRKPSVDLGSGGAPEPAPQRKRLNLLPRTKPVDQDSANKKISKNTKEFFGVRSLDEAEVYFEKLPSMYHHSLVDKLVTLAIESKEADARLVGDFFERAALKKLCSSSAFEEGFLGIAEFLDDIAIDAPKATDLLAIMIKGADLGKEQRTNIASKSAENGDKLLKLSS